MDVELEKKLSAKEIKPTAMRLLVLQYLYEQSHAVSLTDIELAFVRSDRVTLYRTIKKFVEQGLTHAIEDGSGVTKYALCQDECEEGLHHDLHVHFYCNKCKETYCLPKTRIPEVRLPEHFKQEESNLLIKGVCARCEYS